MANIKINGVFYDFSSVQVKIQGGAAINVTSINYDRSVAMTQSFVNGSRGSQGKTAGQVTNSCSFDMTKENAVLFNRARAALAGAAFDIQVTYSTRASATNPVPLTVTDSVLGCQVESESTSGASGGDLITTSYTVLPEKILLDGIDFDSIGS